MTEGGERESGSREGKERGRGGLIERRESRSRED